MKFFNLNIGPNVGPMHRKMYVSEKVCVAYVIAFITWKLNQ